MADGHDLALIADAATGDRDAFDALVRPRLDRLFRLAYAVTRSESDARDATQDACVLAWRQLPGLRDRERFDAWIDQILVNAARMVLRRNGRIRSRELRTEGGDGHPGSDRRYEPSEPSAAESIADAELIRRAFARLDDATRALIVQHHVEGIPVAELARRMRAPTGTVKWRLSRARSALERALEMERR